jgi:hypothetical protein
MSGEAYTKRYPGGFVDLPATSTAIDSSYLNGTESALARLLGADPTDANVMVWDQSLGRFKTVLLTNAHISGTAAIARTKLDFGAGLVDGDLAPGANVAQSKIAGLTAAFANRPLVTYGTTPPGSPADGDIWMFPADATNGVIWQFRYRAASASSYKWEFVGGVPLAVGPSGSMTIATATPTDLTGGPTLTLPRAGDYVIDFGGVAQANGSFAAYNVTVYVFDGVTIGAGISFTPVNAQFMGGTISGIQVRTGLAAATLLKLQAAAQNSNSSLVSAGWMKVMPRRVS